MRTRTAAGKRVTRVAELLRERIALILLNKCADPRLKELTITAVEVSVIISARVNDVRTAQQLGSLIVIPFALIYVLGEIGTIPVTVGGLLLLSLVLIVIDAALFRLSTATFNREEILTRWR